MTRLLLGMALAVALLAHPASAQEDVTTEVVEAEFADVITDVENAIINRGYVVDYHGRIGEMLQRTAGDIGAEKTIYRNAEFLQFCSAVVSRKAMEADITNIAYCPYILFAYEPEAKPGSVTVGFRRLPQGPGRDEVNALLEEILAEATMQ